MKLRWLPEARDDIQRLFTFLLGKNAEAAKRAIRTIQLGADRLIEFPRVGRPMNDDSGRRELFVPFGAGAYVLRYRIHDARIIVIRVWHSREDRR